MRHRTVAIDAPAMIAGVSSLLIQRKNGEVFVLSWIMRHGQKVRNLQMA
jgi:hypothetical protein